MLVVAWLSANSVAHINKVTLCRTWLVLEWLTVSVDSLSVLITKLSYICSLQIYNKSLFLYFIVTVIAVVVHCRWLLVT